MNGRDSLDFGVLAEVAGAMGVKRDRFFFEKLSAFEDTVLAIWDKDDDAETDEEYAVNIKKAMEKFGKEQDA